jgi:lipopolysaccharide/colanic/teichoic acid biosynthesis glycosyltransferase
MTDNGETARPPTGCLRISPARRALDIIVAAVLLVILTPFIAVVMPVIRGRPVFTQVRVGERGRRFVLSKLRTMRVVASGPEVTGQGSGGTRG